MHVYTCTCVVVCTCIQCSLYGVCVLSVDEMP